MKIDKPGLLIETHKITPAEASAMLQKNAGNRPMNLRHVRFLAQEMKRGRFLFNAETIVRDPDGNVMQGQHRLQACADSGVDIEVLVVSGVPREAFPTYDITRPRSAADLLASLGIEKFKTLAAALRFVAIILRRDLSDRNKLSPPEIAEIFEKHPTVLDSVDFCSDSKKLCHPRIIAGLHYLFGSVDREASDSFITLVVSGASLQPGAPAYALRARLIDNLTSRAKLPEYVLAALFIKAWNLHREGKRIEVLVVKRGDSFPDIAGLDYKALLDE